MPMPNLKRLKPLHWMYNLLHWRQLQHQRQAYKLHGVQKPIYGSISSKDFPDKTSRAWLDLADSAQVAPGHPQFEQFNEGTRQQILQWSAKGYMVLPGLINHAEAEAVNEAVNDLLASGKHPLTHDHKLVHAHRLHPAINQLFRNTHLQAITSFLLGKQTLPFQTLNFVQGSGQRAHSDSIHMTTYPLGYLIAAWIALEDIHPDSGPLFYYPGSHKLPYLLNEDFGNLSSRFALGNKAYTDYEEVVETVLTQTNFEKEIFLPQKGDVLIWHANLIHGGMPVVNPSLTRKSMVIHYYAADVIKYHEITERPALVSG